MELFIVTDYYDGDNVFYHSCAISGRYPAINGKSYRWDYSL